MLAINDKDFGTPASRSDKARHARNRRPRSHRSRRHLGDCARPRWPTSRFRNCARPIRSQPFGSCRLCLVEIEGRNGFPASCTTPVEAGMKVRTQSEQLAKLRRGVMELYMSDHPLDPFECKAGGKCELHRDGARGRARARALQPWRRAIISTCRSTTRNPYFTFDPTRCILCSRCVRACDEIQGTFALTIDGRGFDSLMSPGQHRALHRFRMRLVRRLRAGLPDRRADGKIAARKGPRRSRDRHHLRLLRRRMLVQGRGARRRNRAHGAEQGRPAQSRPFVRQGPLRVGLRDASRSRAQRR